MRRQDMTRLETVHIESVPDLPYQCSQRKGKELFAFPWGRCVINVDNGSITDDLPKQSNLKQKKHKEIHWQPKEEEVMRSQQHLLLVRCRQASEVLLVLVTVVLVTSFLRLIWCNRCTATICWRLPLQLNDQFAILGQHDNLPKHTNMHNIHNIYSEYSCISWIFYIILWYITLTVSQCSHHFTA